MISDALADCIGAVNDYMQRYPETYAQIGPRLARLVGEMDEVRAILDTPPAADVLPDLIAWRHDHHVRLFPTSDAGLRALMAEPSFGRYGCVVLTHYGVDAGSEPVARLCKVLRIGRCNGAEVATTLAATSAWRQGGCQAWLPF